MHCISKKSGMYLGSKPIILFTCIHVFIAVETPAVMKVKEIERTANVAWSPKTQYPVYLACGTAAQQLDATFSTKSAIEIFRFNPEEPGFDCELVATAETDHRFNKVRK